MRGDIDTGWELDSLWDRVLNAHKASARAHVAAAELLKHRATPEHAAIAMERAAAALDRLKRMRALQRLA